MEVGVQIVTPLCHFCFAGTFPLVASRGKLVIIPLSTSDEKAKDKIPKGWQSPRPYLRFTDAS